MAAPTPTKTWEFDVNHVGITTRQELMFQLKNKLIGNGATAFSNPPTVKSSSDATTADNTDRWLNSGDITFEEPAGAHSWIVFNLPNVSPNLEMCWSCEDNPGGGANQWECFFSHSAGFTGGTINARPTAADEQNSYTGGSAAMIDANGIGSNPARLHMAQSSDGQVLRMWAYSAAVTIGYFEVYQPTNTATNWADPWVANNSWHKYNTGANAPQATITKLAQWSGTAFTRGYAGGALMNYRYTMEAVGDNGSVEEFLAYHQNYPEDLEPGSCFPFFPMGIFSSTIGARGRIGEAVDKWWGPTVIVDASHAPEDASRTFVKVNDIWLPWTGGDQMAII